MRVAILGPLEVRTGAGDLVEIAGARLRALLVRLALNPGRVVSSEQLIDAVWPTDPPQGAANALQALVSRLRRAVPDLTVESHPVGYRLVLDPDEVDAGRFERLVREGNAAAALKLWRGPALAGFTDIAVPERTRLVELRMSTVEQAAGQAIDEGRGGEWVAELDALCAEYPTREPLAALLMRALDHSGRSADALVAFERARAAIADELGTDPSAELRELHIDLLREPPTAPRRTNLRAGLTSFVGRDDDLQRVADLLTRSRLVTLVGPGGAGKTRLAVECAAATADRYPDGVWLVELAALTDPAELVTSVLAAFGRRETLLVNRTVGAAGASPAERLMRSLRGKRLLIVLDNCEHLIGAAATLSEDVLGQSPDVRILATSREPLAVTGETLWTVEPLAEKTAVRLFLDRARAVRPDFQLDADTAGDVVDLCRALDGMPLAIELAAARLRTMTVAQIARRIDDRFRLLISGSRTALPRHQTLRAVVDWSWDLLTDDERALWRRLSVFAGTADAAAVEAVAGDLDTCYSLVEKSIVVTEEGRFGQLETIKAYGLGRLDEAGEAETVRDLHLAYFLELAEAAEPRLRTHDQVEWLDRLRAEHDNLHAALRWAITQRDTDRALRMVAALGWYWWLAGHRAEGANLAEDAAALPGAVDDPVRAQAQAVASLSILDGNRPFETVKEWINEAARLSTVVDDPGVALRVISPLAEMIATSDPLRQIDAFGPLTHDPDPWARATAHLMRSHARMNTGDDGSAGRADVLAARAEYAALGERWGLATAESMLAEHAARAGHRAEALAGYRAALRHLEELGARDDLAPVRAKLAHELFLQGQLDEARSELEQAQRETESVGIGEALAIVLVEQAELHRLTGDLGAARRAIADAKRLLHALHPSPQLWALTHSAEAGIDIREGDLLAARSQLEPAMELALSSMDAPVIGQVLIAFAVLVLAEGRPADAAALLGAADVTRGGPDHSVPDRSTVEHAGRAALGDEGFAEAYRNGNREDWLKYAS